MLLHFILTNTPSVSLLTLLVFGVTICVDSVRPVDRDFSLGRHAPHLLLNASSNMSKEPAAALQISSRDPDELFPNTEEIVTQWKAKVPTAAEAKTPSTKAVLGMQKATEYKEKIVDVIDAFKQQDTTFQSSKPQIVGGDALEAVEQELNGVNKTVEKLPEPPQEEERCTPPVTEGHYCAAGKICRDVNCVPGTPDATPEEDTCDGKADETPCGHQKVCKSGACSDEGNDCTGKSAGQACALGKKVCRGSPLSCEEPSSECHGKNKGDACGIDKVCKANEECVDKPSPEKVGPCDLSHLMGETFYVRGQSAAQHGKYYCYKIVIGQYIWQSELGQPPATSNAECKEKMTEQYHLGVFQENVASDNGEQKYEAEEGVGGRKTTLKIEQDKGKTAIESSVKEPHVKIYEVDITGPADCDHWDNFAEIVDPETPTKDKNNNNFCEPDEDVMCPDKTTRCSGDQCCPRFRGSNWKTYPCPSARNDYGRCEVSNKLDAPVLGGDCLQREPDDGPDGKVEGNGESPCMECTWGKGCPAITCCASKPWVYANGNMECYADKKDCETNGVMVEEVDGKKKVVGGGTDSRPLSYEVSPCMICTFGCPGIGQCPSNIPYSYKNGNKICYERLRDCEADGNKETRTIHRGVWTMHSPCMDCTFGCPGIGKCPRRIPYAHKIGNGICFSSILHCERSVS